MDHKFHGAERYRASPGDTSGAGKPIYLLLHKSILSGSRRY